MTSSTARVNILSLTVIAGLMLFIANGVVWAQSTAELSGRVTDQTGAVLPGVEVTATQTDTSVSRVAVTNETGSYSLPNLPVGPYRVEVSLPGFRTYVQTGITLQVGARVTVNAALEIGQVAETVEVQADAALVETRSTSVGQVIDNTRVVELPLNGRQVTELILLSGVANTGGVNANNSGVRNYPTTTISVAGGMGNGLTYLLDGGTHNDVYNNLGLPMPFPDALQEFKVETSSMPAQYGQHSAGVMNAVTKSGTNEFHGSLFEFLRSGRFNARNAFALDNDGLKRNQFGGTFGGPIVKNKIFFFGAYQGTPESSRPSTQRQFIPNADMIAGNFTAVAAPACNNNRQITLKAPFNGNRIDPKLFSPAALKMAAALPKTTDPCGEYRFGRPSKDTEHLFVGKVDYQRTDKHSLFARFMGANRFTPNDNDPNNWLVLSVGNLTQRVLSLVVGDTYLIGDGLVSSFRGTLNRSKVNRTQPNAYDLSDFGVKVYIPYPHHMKMTVANGFTITGVNVQPGHYSGYALQLADDFSLVRGTHQMGFGVDFLHSNLNANSGTGAAPTPAITADGYGMGLADFLMGRVNSMRQGNETVGNSRQRYIAFYLQDAWKATSRLTVNAGLRWEPALAPWEAHGQRARFSKEWFDAGIRSTVFPNAPAGLQFPPLRNSGEQVGDAGTTNQYHSDQWLHFAPRLGRAFDPTGNGQMTIRAAGGVFYDYQHLWGYTAQGNNWPFGSQVNLGPHQLDDPYASYPGGNPFPTFPSKNSTFGPFGSYNTYRVNHQAPYVYQWNFSIQRQLGTDWLASGSYLGNSVIHLLGGVEQNPSIFLGTGPCTIQGPNGPINYTVCSTASNVDQRRILFLQNPKVGQYYGAMELIEDGQTSDYNGMLLSIQRRRSNGITVLANYTLSHCLGEPGDSQPGISANGKTYPGRRRTVRGNCDGDRRQVVNLSTVYQTPRFSNTAARALGSGWQISGIVRLQTGSYFTVTSGSDTSLTTAADGNRANQVLADVYAPNKSIDQWLNIAAFARPATGVWGNAANSIIGPGSITINMGMTRKFQIRENQSVEFRAEAFNMPNHVNPDNPNTALNNQNFGKILSAGDPRIMQFALKYLF